MFELSLCSNIVDIRQTRRCKLYNYYFNRYSGFNPVSDKHTI